MSTDPSRRAAMARGAAAITLATAVSRLTGFLRVMVVAAAMGTTFLANTYHTANTAPNLVFELVAAGVLTSIFVPTFVEYLAGGRREEGWMAADALSSVALLGLTAIAGIVALAAEPIMRLLTLGVEDPLLREHEVAVGATFLRLFAPQIVFYGVGMIMTGALHAYRRFAMPAVAPIFNNVVVIAVYITYALLRGSRPPTVTGITAAETWVLGAGTTMGVVAMTVALIPGLRRLGWRFRFRPNLRHPAVRKAARLGGWALSYAGGYQAGLVVVLLLANRISGGVAAYQWAYTFFYMPHALFGVPIFHVLFPEMSEHAARGEDEGLLDRLKEGTRMLAFILFPVAAAMFALAEPLARVTLEYEVMTRAGAELVARVIAAFALGLPAYSLFLVATRAFYALGDTKTPAWINGVAVAISSASGAAFFFLLPERWAVPGLAFGHSVGFAAGAVVILWRLARRVGWVLDERVVGAIVRSVALSLVALAAMWGLRIVLPDASKIQALVGLTSAAVGGGGIYLVAMRLVDAPELAVLRRALLRGAS